MLRGKRDADWPELVASWKARQNELRRSMIVKPLHPLPRFIAGADAAFSKDKSTVFAAAVVYDRIEQKIIEVAHATHPAEVPYIPGFLTFREGPTLRQAIAKLKHPWQAICFDAHGYAHPRRCGLAAHLAIEMDVPGVGVAKSLFVGTFDEPAASAGSTSPLMDKGEQIGIVLRTRDGTRPIFISLGHRVDLQSATELALACCTRYRIPEPTRQADIEVAKLKKMHV
jgi:deoxyribonuclease V